MIGIGEPYVRAWVVVRAPEPDRMTGLGRALASGL